MARNKLKELTKKLWWLLVSSAVVSIIFGLIAIFSPEWTLAALVVTVGFFALLISVFWLIEGLTHIKTDPLWWLGMLFGALGVGLSIFLLGSPEMTITVFMILFAVYIFAQALLDFVIASYTSSGGEKAVWILTGALGVIFGIVLVLNPLDMSLAMVWVLGVYALIHGLITGAYAIIARSRVASVKKKISGGKKSKK